jgi:hypothetical protein
VAPAAEHDAIRYFTLGFGSWMLAVLCYMLKSLGLSIFSSLGAAGRILSSVQGVGFGFGCVFTIVGLAILFLNRDLRK